jgi:hypothetical protein
MRPQRDVEWLTYVVEGDVPARRFTRERWTAPGGGGAALKGPLLSATIGGVVSSVWCVT